MHHAQHLLLTAACQRCRQAIRCCFQMRVTGPSARSSFLPRTCLHSLVQDAAAAEMSLLVGTATCCRSKEHSTITTKPK